MPWERADEFEHVENDAIVKNSSAEKGSGAETESSAGRKSCQKNERKVVLSD